MTGRLLRSVACRELGRWLEAEKQWGYYNRNNARWRSFLLGNISSMLSSDSYAVSGPLRRGVKRLMKDGGGSTGKVHAQGRLCRFSWYQQSQSRQTTTGRLGRAARSCETLMHRPHDNALIRGEMEYYVSNFVNVQGASWYCFCFLC